ncbi:MAG: methyltransferase domain-containing protein [Candidatus Promineifilaceae bacterium]|nr:methyltransferase domain-containing protein [Candidatus Promineifilaceae bacterium]
MSGSYVDTAWREAIVNLVDIRDKIIVDIGCGNGRYLPALLDMGAKQVIGIERSTARLAEAKRRCGALSALSLREATASETGLAPGSCDIVLQRALVRQLGDLSAVFLEMYRILRPGGRVIVQERTMEDVLQPPGPRHLRGYVFQVLERLLELEAMRWPDGHHILAASERSGFVLEKTSRLWERRRTYEDRAALRRAMNDRDGWQILNAVPDAELSRLVDTIVAEADPDDLTDRDRWTIWSLRKRSPHQGF